MEERIILTTHAKQRMIEREITFREIKDALEFPDYTITKNNKTEVYKRIENKTLKIVYLKLGKFIKIITLIQK